MNIAELANLIEAILFYQAEPLSVKRLSSLTKHNEGEVRDALKMLEERVAFYRSELASLPAARSRLGRVV